MSYILHKKDTEILKSHVNNEVYKNISQRHFLIEFFKQLPLEDLKKAVSFEEVDLGETLNYHCELWLDDGIDSLDMGQIKLIKNNETSLKDCSKKL